MAHQVREIKDTETWRHGNGETEAAPELQNLCKSVMLLFCQCVFVGANQYMIIKDLSDKKAPFKWRGHA